MYGIECEQIKQIADVLSFDPYQKFEQDLSQDTLYFMSLMLRRKHKKATRSVASFGLAFGSKHKIVENYRQIMYKYLNHIFDKTD